jgi:hypothetical protein
VVVEGVVAQEVVVAAEVASVVVVVAVAVVMVAAAVVVCERVHRKLFVYLLRTRGVPCAREPTARS